MSQMQMSPDMLLRLLTSKQDPMGAFTGVQQAQAPIMQMPSQQELYGEPGPISAADPFFANAASPQAIEDMDVNKYRQLLAELMKQGYFQGGESMLTDNNALLANRTILDLAGQTVPFIDTLKQASGRVQEMYPEEAFAHQQQQALEQWRLQKLHEARVKQMLGNKLMAGQ